jgi:hypothetical protein
MKKIFLGFIFPLLIAGCSLFSETPKEPTPPAPITIDTFLIESGDTGLVLKNSVDTDFENILSTHPILEAKIEKGILTFTENIDSVPMTQAVNLESFVEFLNKKNETLKNEEPSAEGSSVPLND